VTARAQRNPEEDDGSRRRRGCHTAVYERAPLRRPLVAIALSAHEIPNGCAMHEGAQRLRVELSRAPP
jgi:hypothetical protein